MNQTKVAIITGAGKGIGKAIALGLSQLDYKVVLIGRTKSDLEKVADKIKLQKGFEPIIFSFDIINSKMIQDTVKEIVHQLGRIDVLVNNAGIYFGGSSEISEDHFKKMLDINLTAQFVFLQATIPVMKKQGSGYIFNIASRAGKIGFAKSGGYSASKFGLIGLNESLYRELVPLGIRVTALCPGWVNTKMAFDAGTPLKPDDMIQPEDLFKTIQWLLDLSSGTCVKEVILDAPLCID